MKIVYENTSVQVKTDLPLPFPGDTIDVFGRVLIVSSVHGSVVSVRKLTAKEWFNEIRKKL